MTTQEKASRPGRGSEARAEKTNHRNSSPDRPEVRVLAAVLEILQSIERDTDYWRYADEDSFEPPTFAQMESLCDRITRVADELDRLVIDIKCGRMEGSDHA